MFVVDDFSHESTLRSPRADVKHPPRPEARGAIGSSTTICLTVVDEAVYAYGYEDRNHFNWLNGYDYRLPLSAKRS